MRDDDASTQPADRDLVPPEYTGVLTHQEIIKLCGFSRQDDERATAKYGPIIRAEKRRIRTAGYDLRLGPDYYLRSDAPAVDTLTVSRMCEGERETLVIPAHGVAIVSTLEEIAFSPRLIGHLSLKQDLVMQGLIMPSQSQIDAGYRGGIFVLLYNLGNREVSLQLGEPILRLELVALKQPSELIYHGEYRGVSLAGALKAPIHSALLALHTEVETVQRHVTLTQLLGGIIGLLVLISTIATGVLTYWGPLATRLATLEQRLELASRSPATHERDEEGTSKEIIALRQKVEDLETKLTETAASESGHAKKP